jgi:signal transduction histidine kinase
MSIKKRLSLLISLLLTLLFVSGAFIVEFLYSEFRKDEFKKRLEEKALTYVKLLIDVKEVDSNLLRIIDKNTVGKLYEEKVLIYDSGWKIIYQSPNSDYFHPSIKEKQKLDADKKIYREDKQSEIIGINYTTNGKRYFVFVAANDRFGKKSLEYLIILLLFSTVILSVSGWLLTTYTVRKVLDPIQSLHSRVSKINEEDLHERIQVNDDTNNEIDLLSKEFNLLLERLEKAYQRQKMFTSHASHELKTPLSRIVLQLESLKNDVAPELQLKIHDIIRQSLDLSKLIESLLILAKMEDNVQSEFRLERIDELIFSVIDEIKLEFPACKIDFEIEDNPRVYETMEVLMNHALLRIALHNLMRNAYLYSKTQFIKIKLYIQENQLYLSISNDGQQLDNEDQEIMFQQFGRGKNAGKNEGFGLGLVIVKRIMDHHGFKISYSVQQNLNTFTLHF